MSDPLTALRGLLTGDLRAAGGRIADLQAPLLRGEAAAIATARDIRRAEFTAGRTAARRALDDATAPLPRAADGTPCWPPGVTGSISHAGGWALAVVSRAAAGLGLDIETSGAALPLDEIARPAEIARLGADDPVRLFSAKEAAYKAQFPLSGARLGFHDLAVALHDGGFVATFAIAAPPFSPGDAIAGRQVVAAGLVLSLAVIAA